MKPRTLIALILVIVFLVVLITSQLSNQSYYTDFKTARETGDKVHVVATWVDRTNSHYNAEEDVFTFYLQDTLSNVSLVKYHDPKPPSLESAEKLVIEGRQKGDYFEAEHIYLKCPSKYEDNTLTGADMPKHPENIPR
jgi:cytochrome c-type biogenesis protein CcmE